MIRRHTHIFQWLMLRKKQRSAAQRNFSKACIEAPHSPTSCASRIRPEISATGWSSRAVASMIFRMSVVIVLSKLVVPATPASEDVRTAFAIPPGARLVAAGGVDFLSGEGS